MRGNDEICCCWDATWNLPGSPEPRDLVSNLVTWTHLLSSSSSLFSSFKWDSRRPVDARLLGFMMNPCGCRYQSDEEEESVWMVVFRVAMETVACFCFCPVVTDDSYMWEEVNVTCDEYFLHVLPQSDFLYFGVLCFFFFLQGWLSTFTRVYFVILETNRCFCCFRSLHFTSGGWAFWTHTNLWLQPCSHVLLRVCRTAVGVSVSHQCRTTAQSQVTSLHFA